MALIIPQPFPKFGVTSEVDVRNVIVLVLDDVGREQIRASGKATDAAGFPPQPNLDALAARGVSFTRMYGTPACSMSRACAQFGRYGFHGGWGGLIESSEQPVLLDETGLPKMITQATQAVNDGPVPSGMFGKVHLANFANGRDHFPVSMGYTTYRGCRRNLERGSEDYYSWNRISDDVWRQGPVEERCEVWTPRQTFQDASDWILDVREPFCAWIAVNAAHTPFQQPPAGTYDPVKYPLTTRDPVGGGQAVLTPYFKAMIQATDVEFGRFLERVGPDILGNTYIIVFGDNGTTSSVVNAPYDNNHSKSTIYELSINLPMIVAGPTVDLPGRLCNGLVSLVDLPRTIVELLGGDWTQVSTKTPYDGLSFRSLIESRSAASSRTLAYSEIFSPNGPNLNATTAGSRALVGPQYKLLWKSPGVAFPMATGEFYDLTADENELTNLTPGGATGGLTAGQLSAWNSMTASAGTLLST